MNRNRKTGRGVDALIGEANAETDRRVKAKRERDARVKREKRAAAKASDVEAHERTKARLIKQDEDLLASRVAAAQAGKPMPSGFKPSTAPTLLDRGRTTATFYDGMSPHAAADLKRKIDEAAARPRTAGVISDAPIPVRLSVITLAQSFAEACQALAEAEQTFDRALAARARAKVALDTEIARLANEVT